MVSCGLWCQILVPTLHPSNSKLQRFVHVWPCHIITQVFSVRLREREIRVCHSFAAANSTSCLVHNSSLRDWCCLKDCPSLPGYLPSISRAQNSNSHMLGWIKRILLCCVLTRNNRTCKEYIKDYSSLHQHRRLGPVCSVDTLLWKGWLCSHIKQAFILKENIWTKVSRYCNCTQFIIYQQSLHFYNQLLQMKRYTAIATPTVNHSTSWSQSMLNKV